MVTLIEYIKQNKLPKAAFSKKLGVSPGHLSDLLSGRRLPSLPVALKIEALTQGKVVPRSFVVCSNEDAA